MEIVLSHQSLCGEDGGDDDITVEQFYKATSIIRFTVYSLNSHKNTSICTYVPCGDL